MTTAVCSTCRPCRICQRSTPPTGGARPITSITPQSGRPVCGPDRGQSGLPTAVQICPEDAVCGVRQGEDGCDERLKEDMSVFVGPKKRHQHFPTPNKCLYLYTNRYSCTLFEIPLILCNEGHRALPHFGTWRTSRRKQFSICMLFIII